MFYCLIENLCETGSMSLWKQNWHRTHTDEATEVAVLDVVACNQSSS
jgi:hypothetical protein